MQLLDQVRVDAYGTPMPINQLAQITTPEAGMIVVQPWDLSQLKEIEKALRAPEHGFNPSNDGKQIRVPIPPMTEDPPPGAVVKQLNRVSLKITRPRCATSAATATRAFKKLAKDKKIGEDEEKRAQDEVQSMLNEEIRRMEASCAAQKKPTSWRHLSSDRTNTNVEGRPHAICGRPSCFSDGDNPRARASRIFFPET